MFRGTSSPNDPALAQYWTHGRERPPADPGQVHRDPAQNPKTWQNPAVPFDQYWQFYLDRECQRSHAGRYKGQLAPGR